MPADLDPYVQQLIDAVHPVVPQWLERCVVQISIRQTGACSPPLHSEAAAMATSAAAEILARLDALLVLDVDAQATNPLSVLRWGVRYPTEVLVSHSIPPVRRDDFAVRAFPSDVYNLSPATWADVDESLQEPGLIWGAWKAKTVLDRRRATQSQD
ncbi:MAG: hypothetical protein ABIR32_11230 [Ilumatobacteraceae bacterium]